MFQNQQGFCKAVSVLDCSGLCFCYHGLPTETFCWTWTRIKTTNYCPKLRRYKLHFYTFNTQVFEDGDTFAHFCLAAATLLQHHLHRDKGLLHSLPIHTSIFNFHHQIWWIRFRMLLYINIDHLDHCYSTL